MKTLVLAAMALGISCSAQPIFPLADANATLSQRDAEGLMMALVRQGEMLPIRTQGAYAYFTPAGVFIQWRQGEFICSVNGAEVPREAFDAAMRTVVGQGI